MVSSPDRRAVLGGALVLPFGFAAFAGQAAAQGAGLTTTEIRPGVFVITGGGAAVTAVKSSEGAILVDGGDAEHAQAIVAEALRATGSTKVAALFNTNWQLAYSGANDILGAQNVPIYASENTRAWTTTTIWRKWEDKTYKPRAKAAQPTKAFRTSQKLTIGDQAIQLAILPPAVTDGDIFVKFDKANVLVLGPLAAADRWAPIDWSTGGYLGNANNGIASALNAAIAACDADTIVVPSWGPLMNRDVLAAQAGMYGQLGAQLSRMMQGGAISEIVAANPAKDFEATFGNAQQFLTLAVQSKWPREMSNG